MFHTSSGAAGGMRGALIRMVKRGAGDPGNVRAWFDGDPDTASVTTVDEAHAVADPLSTRSQQPFVRVECL